MLMLLPHPQNDTQNVEAVCANYILHGNGILNVQYKACCNANEIVLGSACKQPERGDNLWESTVFEVFLKNSGTTRYTEYNFSTGRKWAAYRFSDYRAEMRNETVMTEPKLNCLVAEDSIILEAQIKLPHDMRLTDLKMAMTAIIYEHNGIKSHWSLAHPEGAADFHHQACFVEQVAAPINL